MNQIIFQRKNASKIITIKEERNEYFIICFDQTIMMISISDVSLLEIFFQNQKDSTIILVNNFIIPITIPNKIINIQKISKYENISKMIDNFSSNFSLTQKDKYDKNIFNNINETISCYLIMKAFSKLNFDRIANFEYNSNFQLTERFQLNEDEFIELQDLKHGSSSCPKLIYHIEKERLYLLKRFISKEENGLIQREYINYSNINHPFLPVCYGINEKAEVQYLILEYISGNSLEDISEMKLNYDEKCKIIFQLMIVIEYLHNKGFIYRDLKPNNVIIDRNKNVILIDFDRMIFEKGSEQNTKDFLHNFIAPEIVDEKTKYSYEADYYSLGLMVYFIIFEKFPDKNQNKFDFSLFESQFNKQFESLKLMCERCTEKDPIKRGKLSEIIDFFFIKFISNISLQLPKPKKSYSSLIACNDKFFPYWLYSEDYNDSLLRKELGINEEDINETPQNIKKIITFLRLAFNQNHIFSHFYLNLIYAGDNKIIYYSFSSIQKCDFSKLSLYNTSLILKLVEMNFDEIFNLGLKYLSKNNDVDKAIKCFSYLGNLNHIYSLDMLGSIYFNNKYGKFDLDKAIYYFTIAANQSYGPSIHTLGIIYLEFLGDEDKAIHYFKIGANLNYPDSLCKLGTAYLLGDYVERDIQKAIVYLELAGSKYNTEAYYFLGLLYDTEEFVPRDVEKAIYYYELAAERFHSDALFQLGVIYSSDKQINKDIEKAIYYFDLAAKQNHLSAQYHLAEIYLQKNKINKAFHLFCISAQQNEKRSLRALGKIYKEGKYVPKNIHLAVNYLQRATDLGEIKAQYLLGRCYLDEHEIRDIDKGLDHILKSIKKGYFLGEIQLYMKYFLDCNIREKLNKSKEFKEISFIFDKNCPKHELGIVNILLNKDPTCLIISAKEGNLESIAELGKYYCYLKHNKLKYYLNLTNYQKKYYSELIIGIMYTLGVFIPKDLGKAIDHLKVSASQSNILALFSLGYIYSELLEENELNLKESIKYYKLAMNKSNLGSIHNLGIIYHTGKKVEKDINKAIRYFEIAAERNYAKAKYNLGYIYLFNKKNISKGLNYIKEAEKQYEKNAIYILGILYYQGYFLPKNIRKSIKYLSISTMNNIKNSYYLLGFFYSEKSSLDIKLSIDFYNQSSNLENQYAKNNLALIYKNGYGVDINIHYSIELLKEAISQKNDPCAMYNLANIYFYLFKEDLELLDKSINLLINSFKCNFYPSKEFLSLVIMKRCNAIQIEDIEFEIKNKCRNYKKLSSELFDMIKQNNLDDFTSRLKWYDEWRYIEYEYDFFQNPFQSTKFFEKYEVENNEKYNIDESFFEGFGDDL